MLAAASHVNYLLYPAVNVQSLYTGDVFRFAFYAVLLVGSMREISSYWHALSKAAVLEERQRIACDLHDGVAQELAYLARNLNTLSGIADEERLTPLRRAVERAQLESRRAISAMAAPSGQPFEVALAEAAADVADRYHVELDMDITSDIRLSAARREALVRIACEAVTNAARHSGAGGSTSGWNAAAQVCGCGSATRGTVSTSPLRGAGSASRRCASALIPLARNWWFPPRLDTAARWRSLFERTVEATAGADRRRSRAQPGRHTTCAGT